MTTVEPTTLVGRIASLQNYKQYNDLHWEGSFEDYLQIVRDNPDVTRNAFQRLYDMINSYGRQEYIDAKKKLVKYSFFNDELHGGKDAIFGLDIPLMKLVSILRSAAHGYGPERRVILLHGPVGSSKSTIARLLKKGAEAYSRKAEGALYTYHWSLNGDARMVTTGPDPEIYPCPMNDEPLKLIPREWRQQAFERLGLKSGRYPLRIDGDLNPSCRYIFKHLMQHYGGDFSRVVRHVRVKRLILSEQDRIGIGTFQPKDEKNQDSTELTGDINYRKIAEYGSDSDPRAFNFDGELNIANRGMVELIEALKLGCSLSLRFARRLPGTGASSPRKFAQVRHRRGASLAHTNEPEYKQAAKQRVYGSACGTAPIKIDIPYVTRLSRRGSRFTRRILTTTSRFTGKHLAPHTLEMASMWAVLTRLEEPKHARADPCCKNSKLYEGKSTARFYRGQHQGVAQAETEPRGHGRDFAALCPGQDL